MKAVRIAAIGEPLQNREMPVPQIGEGEVLVRVEAAGICRSDAHYRAGTSTVGELPITPGHEVAGTVEKRGSRVSGLTEGDRVCLHYLVTCGICRYCRSSLEAFCENGQMIGKHRDGGYAEYIAVPAVNAVRLPEEIPFSHGSVLMCSSATAFHALRRARLEAGDTVAVFGLGGLGMSAVQLARLSGASKVIGVDIDADKRRLAEGYSALTVDASEDGIHRRIRGVTDGRGVDVAVDLTGIPSVMSEAVRSLGVRGRLALVGITDRNLEVNTYKDLIGKEAEVIGVSDHLLSEIHTLIGFVRTGGLDLKGIVSETIPLEAGEINRALDDLESGTSKVRVVIEP